MPVYVFQSIMADFNYYSKRDQIPVVASKDHVSKLTLSGREAYLIINDKDLQQIKSSVRFNVVTEHQVGEKKWYVLRLS